ncbi:hypothetical protein ABK921_19390, partial [Enterobacter kobei]|uniref:hypothetical protein n=2 Tax=Enterobacter kobei TaxID=208224 RepID=UPI0030763AFB
MSVPLWSSEPLISNSARRPPLPRIVPVSLLYDQLPLPGVGKDESHHRHKSPLKPVFDGEEDVFVIAVAGQPAKISRV